MGRLSNLFGRRDQPSNEQAAVVCRPVHKDEIESGLRLILADGDSLASDEILLEFLAFAVQRQIDLNEMWIAVAGDQIGWVLLPMSSPGHTMLMLTPPKLLAGTMPRAARLLTEAVCDHWRGRGVQLAQFLLPPDDAAIQAVYESCGFEVLAELIYLQRSVGPAVDVVLPVDHKLHNYNTATHAQFAEAIVRSYEGSFDCPSLNGRRNIDDVIAGHKGTGLFDPSAWHVLTEHGLPRGVLILSPAQHNEVIELVYLGLAPESRGKGLANVLMRLAFNEARRLDRRELSLAVDSRNAPALKLYHRHGLRTVGSRLALLRDLRSATPAPAK